MADFCKDCTEDLFGDASREEGLSLQNDLAGLTDTLVPALCEGCGAHVFDSTGKRICEMEGRPPEDEVTADLCEACLKVLEDEEE